MTDEQKKNFTAAVLQMHAEIKNLTKAYDTVKKDYVGVDGLPTYNSINYTLNYKNAAKVRGKETEIEKPKVDVASIAYTIRMLNNLIESLTAEDWAEEQMFLKGLREDYLTKLEGGK